jgi:hypothetical protein
MVYEIHTSLRAQEIFHEKLTPLFFSCSLSRPLALLPCSRTPLFVPAENIMTFVTYDKQTCVLKVPCAPQIRFSESHGSAGVFYSCSSFDWTKIYKEPFFLDVLSM